MEGEPSIIDIIPLEGILDEATAAEQSKIEIGAEAVWSVSSAKPGYGVEHLRDDSLDTFWQSDGAQPHIINIHFRRKVEVQEVAFHCNFKQDESYTPQKVVIRTGTTLHDLVEVFHQDLVEPTGWTRFHVPGLPIRTNLIQIGIVSNHQGGRDTHLRQIKVFGPRKTVTKSLKIPSFGSSSFNSYSMVK